MASEFVKQDEWLIRAGELEPKRSIRIIDGDTAYNKDRVADMQAALKAQYPDKPLIAYWHGRYTIYWDWRT